MDMSKILPLYYEGQAYIKRCDDLLGEMPELVSINPYDGYVQLTREAFADFVKDPDSVRSTKMSSTTGWTHEAVVNGVCFCCVTEGEDLYGN